MDAAQLRPLSVGEMLDVAIKIYRERFAPMAKAVVVVVAPVAVITALVQLSLAPDDPDEVFGPVDATGRPTSVDAGEIWSFAAGFLVVALLSYVAAQLATAASFKLVAGAYLDEAPDWRASLSGALQRLGSLVWLTMVFGFLLGLGFVACIVPGVYLYVAWSVAVPVLLLEDLRGRKALKRSRELVKGRWWPILGAIVVSGILAGVIQAVFAAVLVAVVGTDGNDVAGATAGALANIAGSMVTTPFSAAVIMVVYFDLRVRKEGFDLELLARRVGVEPPAGGYPAPGGAAVGGWPAPEDPWRPSSGPSPSAGGGSQPPFWPPPPGWAPPEAPPDDASSPVPPAPGRPPPEAPPADAPAPGWGAPESAPAPDWSPPEDPPWPGWGEAEDAPADDQPPGGRVGPQDAPAPPPTEPPEGGSEPPFRPPPPAPHPDA